MKFPATFAIIMLALFFILPGCQKPKPTALPAPTPEPMRISPEDITADLHELLAAFTDLHPAPFWSQSQAQFEAEIERIVTAAKAQGGATPAEWFRTVARFVIRFDDPHCWVFVPGWKAYRDGGGKFFPLELRFDGPTAKVTEPAWPGVPVGSKIATINGEKIESLIREFRPLTGQADDPFGDEFLATFFRRYLWYLRGWSETFQLEIETPTGRQTVEVPGGTQAEYEIRKAQSQQLAALEYRPLGKGVGLLEFRACVSKEKIRALAEPIFARLRQEGVAKLIVDARQNSGGGDDAWITLLEFLTEKPFSGYSSTRYRISQRLKDLHGEVELAKAFSETTWMTPNGTEVVNKRVPGDLITPPANPLRFSGQWCVLAGRGTFSSGMSFVCAVKGHGLAKVIGSETGGRVKGFGQWLEVKLPRTGLSVAISTKQFDGAVDVPYRRGVPPDVPVDPTPMTTERDPVLRAAVAELTKPR